MTTYDNIRSCLKRPQDLRLLLSTTASVTLTSEWLFACGSLGSQWMTIKSWPASCSLGTLPLCQLCSATFGDWAQINTSGSQTWCTWKTKTATYLFKSSVLVEIRFFWAAGFGLTSWSGILSGCAHYPQSILSGAVLIMLKVSSAMFSSLSSKYPQWCSPHCVQNTLSGALRMLETSSIAPCTLIWKYLPVILTHQQ